MQIMYFLIKFTPLLFPISPPFLTFKKIIRMGTTLHPGAKAGSSELFFENTYCKTLKVDVFNFCFAFFF
jgi:hypothetical protein